MNSFRMWAAVGMVVVWVGMGSQTASAQVAQAHSGSTERARIVVAQALPKLDGDHLKATVVEVNYGPGEASPPHSHACAVIGYVAEGTLRTQVQGEAEEVYQAGQSFYEPPNSVHLVSANASQTEPARLLAYFVCDHDAPLSTDVDERGDLLKARESVWRSWFANDTAALKELVPAESIVMSEGEEKWKHQTDVLQTAEAFRAGGGKLVRLEFPRTEIQRFGDVAIIWSSYVVETEVEGKRSTSTGRVTEIFVLRDGQWTNPGWHTSAEK